jgi:hypothetical protein
MSYDKKHEFDEPLTPEAKKRQHEELLERIRAKKAKNRLMVDDASNDDNSFV